MALLDHITRCNRWEPAQFMPLLIGSVPLGLVRRDLVPRLMDFPDVITRHHDRLALAERWTSPGDRSAAIRPMLAALAADGLIEPLRGEDYRVVTEWGAASLMVIDRAAVPAFGLRAFGVHVNGVVQGAAERSLWIAKRSAHKSIEPGKLDNLVAGGQPAGLSLADNVIKEAAEEAGLADIVARRARPVGSLRYCMAESRGLKRDTLFLFDLEMPADIVPRAVDGEVESFAVMDWRTILDVLRDGFAFKFNVALVLIDFMIRHGLLDPDREPDYPALVAGLHLGFEP